MAIVANLPASEAQRLKALRSYGILDTGREAAFDDLTCIAAQICNVPMALVSLVDENRQWFKSAVGLDAPETPRAIAFCAHAILQDQLFVVPDAHKDERFHDNAMVTGAPHLRFYAGAPLHTVDGHKLGTLCVLDRVPRDLDSGQLASLEALARQAMAQMELRRSLEEAERVIRYRTRLMEVMGRDLKEPVNILHMALGVFAERLQATDDDMFRYATDAVDQLGRELDALAEASHLDRASVHKASFPIQHLLDNVFDSWSLRARRKGLRFDIASSTAVIVNDEQLLTTIVGNLVGNAIKYTEAGTVSVECWEASFGLAITVADTGIGIPDDQLDMIFEPFHQVIAVRSEGLGLGLSVVQRTTELIGCAIGVTSEPGVGSRFTITVPPDTF
jgi:signal transduction histidine kinase